MQQEEEAQRELEDEEARREQEEMDREIDSSGSPGEIDPKEQCNIDAGDAHRRCILRTSIITSANVGACTTLGFAVGSVTAAIGALPGVIAGAACGIVTAATDTYDKHECNRQLEIDKAKCN